MLAYCTHGIHRLFHSATPMCSTMPRTRPLAIMKPGHAFTIQPMISQGELDSVLVRFVVCFLVYWGTLGLEATTTVTPIMINEAEV